MINGDVSHSISESHGHRQVEHPSGVHVLCMRELLSWVDQEWATENLALARRVVWGRLIRFVLDALVSDVGGFGDGIELAVNTLLSATV